MGKRKNGNGPPATELVPKRPHEPEIYDHMNQGSAQNEDGRYNKTCSPTRDRSSSLPTISGRKPLKASSANSTKKITTAVLPDVKKVVRQEVLKLSAARILEVTSEAASLPVHHITPAQEGTEASTQRASTTKEEFGLDGERGVAPSPKELRAAVILDQEEANGATASALELTPTNESTMPVVALPRPKVTNRSVTTPVPRRNSVSENRRIRSSDFSTIAFDKLGADASKNIRTATGLHTAALLESVPTPSSHVSSAVPIPPYSMPTYLQLELSSNRPSPLYIHRSTSYDTPYESTRVKYERLLNFILLPPQLEQILWFGTLACLDAWLYAFTILPLRFLKATGLCVEWLILALAREAADLSRFIYKGAGRIWNRKRRKEAVTSKPLLTVKTGAARPDIGSRTESKLSSKAPPTQLIETGSNQPQQGSLRRRRSSTLKYRKLRIEKPSRFQANHKADILQGLLIVVSCMILMRFDASRMYHSIRGQAAIKLYVIYNVLEVFDRLFSALGQDILECLFSPDTLNRDSQGHIQIMRPLGLFVAALLYCVVHSTALFYQVITLNVAVNSYSNALLTLLMSNQFVEIKGTVFKKIEKENLFQLTCADVVERFQLWLMLLIIALRNIVEVGGLSIILTDFTIPFNNASPSNSTAKTFGMLPKSFTILPSLLPYQILGPFLLVLGSEAIVDWVKHAYITKFNATSPKVYGRFFDVLAKDYYSNAFSEQNLTRRFGLPVIPLACLFIRATLQTYHMFLATNVSFAPPISTAYPTTVSLNPAIAKPSPLLAQIDRIVRQALGRSSFGGGTASATEYTWTWTVDDTIAFATMLAFFLVVYLLLLAFKLALGMLLLGIARRRYKGMKLREQDKVVETAARRLGGWGAVETGDERRKIIYEGDPEGLKAMREREAKGKKKEEGEEAKAKGNKDFEGVERYRMVAKRIW